MTDEIVNSGFGYATDEVDTSKFTKEEMDLWFNLVDNETYQIKIIVSPFYQIVVQQTIENLSTFTPQKKLVMYLLSIQEYFLRRCSKSLVKMKSKTKNYLIELTRSSIK